MVQYRYLGYGVTNEEGIAKLDHDAQGNLLTHSYTGTGAGEIDIVASLDSTIGDSSIVSETYSIYDCDFYDKGTTGTPHTEWWRSCASNSTLTSNNTGLTFTTLINQTCYLAPNKIGTSKSSMQDLIEWDNFVCEFTYHSATVSASIELRDANSNVATATLKPSNISDGDVIRVEYTDNVAKFYKNGSPLTTDTTNCSGVVMIRFGVNNGNIIFSEFKVYPI